MIARGMFWLGVLIVGVSAGWLAAAGVTLIAISVVAVHAGRHHS